MADTPADRRTFFMSTIYGLWGLMTAAIAVPASAYLLFPPKARKGAKWVEVADLAALQKQQPQEVIYRRTRVDGWKAVSEKTTAWLVKQSDNEVVAFAPQCTHLGCAYHWENGNKGFLCPCHTSVFSIDGKVVTGPAPRPLDRLGVKIEGGKILLGPAGSQNA